MGTGDQSQAPVVRGEVIHEPDDITYPGTLFVSNRSHVGMEWLSTGLLRIGRASIHAAELVVFSQDHLDQVQDSGVPGKSPEDFSLVDQVREATRIRFLFEFAAGTIPFLFKQLLDALVEFIQFCWGGESWQQQKPLFIE